MMAPDLTTLYRFETNIESGFALALKSVTPNIYTQRQDVDKITPRAELKFTLGDRTGHRSFDNAGVLRYDTWGFKLEVSFLTDRNVNFASHETMIGMSRGLLEDLWNTVNFPGNFPYYAIWLLAETGTIPGFHADDDTDYSQISFTGMFSILPGAWPAN